MIVRRTIAKAFIAGLLALTGTAARVEAGPIYQLTSARETWLQAEAEAVSLGGHLVAINDAPEQALVLQLFGGTERFWIGLTDQAVEGTFVWSNGDPVTYTNWLSGEPNNFLGDEDYTIMNKNEAGKWNDVNVIGSLDGGPFRGIIEIQQQLSAVPEPGSVVLVGTGGLALMTFGWRRRAALSTARVAPQPRP